MAESLMQDNGFGGIHEYTTIIRKDEQCDVLKASYSTHLSNRRRYEDPEYFFTTAIFSCKNHINVEWQLALIQRTEAEHDYISLNLCLKRSDIPELQVYFKCTLKRSSERIQSFEKAFKLSLPETSVMCVPDFVDKSRVSWRRLHQIELSCKIRALPGPSPWHVTVPDVAVPVGQLAEDLSQLLRDEALADVTLEVADRKLRAHKAILAARSPVFARMLQDDMREARESRVRIDDVGHEVMSAFLKFAYTARLDAGCGPIAGALIVAADKYQFEELKRASANLLLRRMSVENAIDTLQLAEMYNFADLKLKVIEFINKHAKDIVKTQAFKNLTSTQAHLIAEIYSVMAMAVSGNKGKSDHGVKRIHRRR